MARPFSNRKRRGGKSVRGAMNYNRRNAFGKLSTPIEEFAYEMAMDSTDFYSNEHGGNSATLVEGPFADLRDFYSSWGFLIRSERQEIASYVGCIVREGSQGNIDVEWFEKRSDLDRAWLDVQDEFPSEESNNLAWMIEN